VTDAATVEFRALLEEERDSLLPQLAELGFGDAGGLRYDPNFADTSQVTAERGEAEALAGQLKDALEAVEKALAKLDQGTYGTCERCGKPISNARLQAMPASAYCIDCASARR
jgi:RNA polymerase-binding transcription factor DksA